MDKTAAGCCDSDVDALWLHHNALKYIKELLLHYMSLYINDTCKDSTQLPATRHVSFQWQTEVVTTVLPELLSRLSQWMGMLISPNKHQGSTPKRSGAKGYVHVLRIN